MPRIKIQAFKFDEVLAKLVEGAPALPHIGLFAFPVSHLVRFLFQNNLEHQAYIATPIGLKNTAGILAKTISGIFFRSFEITSLSFSLVLCLPISFKILSSACCIGMSK